MDAESETTPKKRRRRGPVLSESERKHKKKEANKKANANRISIASQYDRWITLKEVIGFKTHADVAKMLLDQLNFRYRNNDVEKAKFTAAALNGESSSAESSLFAGDSVCVEEAGSDTDNVRERKAICGQTDLLDLANLSVQSICSRKSCNEMVSVTAKYIGTSAQLNWVCANNHHVYTWNSQPTINDVPATDVMLPSILSKADFQAVKITFRKIGIEIISPAKRPQTGEIATQTMDDEMETLVKKEPEDYSMYYDSPQEYPMVGVGNIKTEQTDDNNEGIEHDGLGSKEIKVEVMSDDETDTANESESDEEFTDMFNYIDNSKNVKKISEVRDDVTKECGIRSSRIKERGYLPDYSQLEWNEEMESSKKLKCKETKRVKNDNEASISNFDPDFQISESDYGESDDSERLIDNVSDDETSEDDEGGAKANTGKKSKNTSKKRKCEPRKEGIKRQKTEKKKYTKKPWIKICLADHEDKYQTEKVQSYERKNRGSDVCEEYYSCLVCKHFKCTTTDSIESHIEKHVNKALECESCQYIGYCRKDIREHRMKSCGVIGTGRKVFFCDICGMSTYTSKSKRNHMGKVHDIAEWSCRYCPEMFKTGQENLEHMREVHSELCQYCEACRQSKHQLSKEEFEDHKKKCYTKKQCDICGQIYAKGCMRKHILDKHENVRKYQCEKCPYAAKTFSRLRYHLLKHDNIHPISCDHCPFTCVQACQLVSHMRTHTGEKPYKCTQCKYAAAWKVQLKDHVKVHTMDTAVMCEKCEVMFKNEKTLNLHEKKGQCKV